MNTPFLKLMPTAVLAVAMAVVGCSKQDQANVKTAADDAVSQVKKGS